MMFGFSVEALVGGGGGPPGRLRKEKLVGADTGPPVLIAEEQIWALYGFSYARDAIAGEYVHCEDVLKDKIHED